MKIINNAENSSFSSLKSGDVFLYEGKLYLRVDVPNYTKCGIDGYDIIAVELENSKVHMGSSITGNVLKVEATLSYEV